MRIAHGHASLHGAYHVPLFVELVRRDPSAAGGPSGRGLFSARGHPKVFSADPYLPYLRNRTTRYHPCL